MPYSSELKIDLSHIATGLTLTIEQRSEGRQTLFHADQTEEGMYEAPCQLLEGQYYDFEFSSDDYCFRAPGGKRHPVVHPRRKKPHLGTLEPNIFVGTLKLEIALKSSPETAVGSTELEVRSVKTGYRDDYRNMLEYITEKCTALLMQSESPVTQAFDVDYSGDYETLYQRFSFIRSVVGSDEFAAAMHRIVTAPVTGWKEITEMQDVRRVRRFSGSGIRQITKGVNRQKLHESHPLRDQGIDTLPSRIGNSLKTDTVDTPENRFIKHALETFAQFCTEIRARVIDKPDSTLFRESDELLNSLETHLQHTVFNDISRPTTLRINSPVLQRKAGYREVLRAWLMFDLAAKLIWKGGDDVYSAGKKDIATLYEYWLFFQLLDLFSSVFHLPHKELDKLIKSGDDGLNLTIKQGKETALSGRFKSSSREFNIRFSYNRTFSGSKDDQSYPKAGSWTSAMRPDYTLSVWPSALREYEAEKEELIVHIHFDAKYKVENMAEYLKEQSDEDLSDQKTDERKGRYKNADLLKMHAYKDAIRRTGGAYVLYPGTEEVKRHGFHEIIPGLGAFPVKPSKDETGISELRSFIASVMAHFENRVSQREKLALRTYDVHKDKPSGKVEFLLPDTYGKNRGLIPDETFVLVGYYRKSQKAWIEQVKKYNFRSGEAAGALPLNPATVSAKYLLLHGPGESESGNLWQITSASPVIWNKQNMIDHGYSNPKSEYYLIVDIEPVADPEFKDLKWDFTRLTNYQTGSPYHPFTCTLAELMQNISSR
ncbi:MAG: DUF2357 domain-containing protein [Balneolia bacterium]|nr:DUF2357 domain-containing protein [Balneolia bacterium]